jgi:hypothetical protein
MHERCQTKDIVWGRDEEGYHDEKDIIWRRNSGSGGHHVQKDLIWRTSITQQNPHSFNPQPSHPAKFHCKPSHTTQPPTRFLTPQSNPSHPSIPLISKHAQNPRTHLPTLSTTTRTFLPKTTHHTTKERCRTPTNPPSHPSLQASTSPLIPVR